jgi:hypothetical protein
VQNCFDGSNSNEPWHHSTGGGGGHLSWGALVLEGHMSWGAFVRGALVLGGTCPGGRLTEPRTKQLSGSEFHTINKVAA